MTEHLTNLNWGRLYKTDNEYSSHMARSWKEREKKAKSHNEEQREITATYNVRSKMSPLCKKEDMETHTGGKKRFSDKSGAIWVKSAMWLII